MARPEPSSVRASARRFFRLVNPSIVYTPAPRTDIAELWLGGGEILAIVTHAERSGFADGADDAATATASVGPDGGTDTGTDEPRSSTSVAVEDDSITVTLGADGRLPRSLRTAKRGVTGVDSAGNPAVTIDATGLAVCPGWVDMHVHCTGGGGEAGFKSRTPEATKDQLISAGITTFVGVLGTDSVSRTTENLVAKVRGLAEEGMTGYMWTGAYRFPPPTLTGSVIKDVMLVPEVLGVGELAISDHRGSQPTSHELARLASDARVGGMLSSKAGLVYCHVGKEASGLDPLWAATKETAIPMQAFVPTHVSRTPELTTQAIAWVRAGGFADVCSGRKKSVAAALRMWNDIGDERTERTRELNKGFPGEIALDRVSISSDCYGSKPTFDDLGNCIAYDYQRPSVLMDIMSDLLVAGVPPETVIRMLSTNPARTLGLFPRKGTIREGADADLLIFNIDEVARDDDPGVTAGDTSAGAAGGSSGGAGNGGSGGDGGDGCVEPDSESPAPTGGWELLYVILRGQLVRSPATMTPA